MKKRLNKKGQPTMEYLVVLAAIVAAAIYVLTTTFAVKQPDTGVGKIFNDAAEVIEEETAALEDLQ